MTDFSYIGNAGALEHFAVQAQFLEQKANTLLDASKALKSIISDVKDDKSIPFGKPLFN